MTLRLTVVGCAPAWSKTPGRSSSSYLVTHGSTAVVLDLGQGAFSETWRYTSFADVAAVAISHMHADHNVDLIPLRHWAKFENRGYGPALYGPTELRQKIGEYQADPDFLADLHGETNAPRSFAVGDLRIEAAPVTHIPDSWAFRVSAATGDGAGLVYSGDCAVADDLLPLVRPGDTLLCEAAFGAGVSEARIHLTAAEAAGVAARGDASRLVLTHIQDGRNEFAARAVAEGIFERDVEVARPGLEIDIREARAVTVTTRDLVEQRFRAAASAGLGHAPDVIEVMRPERAEHGDFATNLALKAAAALKRPPREIAADLVTALNATASDELIVRAEVAGPGFVNVWLTPAHVERALDAIRAAGLDYGRTQTDTPSKINVEFVSANPTGPLTVGNARGAFVGDLLCRVLEAVGHQVTREYYFNDTGGQVERLGNSIAALKRGQAVPDDGYHGAYVQDLADQLPDEMWQQAQADDSRAGWIIGAWASESIRAGIEASLAHLGVRFDIWTTEGSLHDRGFVSRGIEKLRASGHLFEQDGALWFRSTAFGDDKDRVVIRSNSEPTYFASDIGYVSEKFSRGFDELIYIWGADHHGTIARLKNAAQALGFDRDAVNVLLIAWVHFVVDGVELSMSKRSGNFSTLDDLLNDVGVDAARWFFASRAPSTGIDFDIELARKQSAENPVYYVQYAHARISSILRKAAEADLTTAELLEGALSDDEVALGLAKDLLRLPDIVRDAAAQRETQAITTFATDLATAFHAFYRDRRVVDTADPQTSAQRLALVDAVRTTLAASLALLGISAPEAM